MQHSKFGLALLASASLFGCVEAATDADSVEETIAETEQAVEVDNGISLNGISLNGISLNGISLNGISLNGISLNGISLNGISLNGISLNGISLNGISLNGSSLDGTSLTGVVGATMTGVLSNGASLPLRIDGVSTGTGSNSDVGMFDVKYLDDNGWQPLCGTENGAPILALAVPGTWNTGVGVPGGGDYMYTADEFTFACRGKTIAKCVELGYKTWNGHTDQLASCVRLLRADYCGDGRSYTSDGTLLNLYDDVGVQFDTQSWNREAEWTPDGARCVTPSRSARFLLNFRVPSCLGNALPVTTSCGTSFANGANLISEMPPLR